MNINKSPDNKIEIPVDDGLIDEALLNLDAKLDAWAEAIMRTEKSAVQNLQLEEVVGSSETLAVAEIVEEEPADDQSDSEKKSTPFDLDKAIGGLPTDSSPSTISTHLEEAKGEEVSVETSIVDSKDSETENHEINSAVDTENEIVSDEDKKTDQDNDDALLADLDDEVLKKVQVIRRINHQKSLREIIEQVQSSAATEKTPENSKPKKGLFWRK